MTKTGPNPVIEIKKEVKAEAVKDEPASFRAQNKDIEMKDEQISGNSDESSSSEQQVSVL